MTAALAPASSYPDLPDDTLMTPELWTALAFFRPDETYQPAAGGPRRRSFPEPGRMRWGIMRRIDQARRQLGRPLIVTSSWRPGGGGAHPVGYAVDVSARGNQERENIDAAFQAAGIFRRGIYTAHVHGDVHPTFPRGIWGGASE